MSICKNEEMNKGGSYPRSCPTCGFGQSCTKGIEMTNPKLQGFGKAVEKYAALKTEHIYHEGDERSRTNPGHGYPAYTQNVDAIVKFKDEEDMKRWVKNRSKFEKYTIIKYVELSVETEVVVRVK